MPLPAPLGHINVWLVDEQTGWTLIDTGLRSEETLHAWRVAFVEAMSGRPLNRVVCTHMHPDHIGMAGWLTQQFQCRLWTSRLEYLTCRVLIADTGTRPPADVLRFYRRAGWGDTAIQHYTLRFGEFGRSVFPLPVEYRRLVDGEEFDMGGRVWRVVVGEGHSPEHLCLHCPELRLLISGDQVLPRISSNVSVFPLEPDGDPLHQWMESLRSIRLRVPADTLVLPAHGEPFHGPHQRLDEMLAGHHSSLDRLRSGLARPLRAVDTFPLLFRREIKSQLLTAATGESLAHLNYLVRRGDVVRTRDEHGVDWYRSK